MNERVTINALPLPRAIVAAMVRGAWRAPPPEGGWYNLFPASEVVEPVLYPLQHMKKVNADWRDEPNDSIYRGRADKVSEPGYLDPRFSLLVGELQPDAMIGLDYRTSVEGPSVVYFTAACRWIEVAKAIDLFIEALSLGGRESGGELGTVGRKR